MDKIEESVEKDFDDMKKNAIIDITHSTYKIAHVYNNKEDTWKGFFKQLAGVLDKSEIKINNIVKIEIEPYNIKIHTLSSFRLNKDNNIIRVV